MLTLLNKCLKFGIRDVRVPIDEAIASIETNIRGLSSTTKEYIRNECKNKISKNVRNKC